jgi:hypothetical protein
MATSTKILLDGRSPNTFIEEHCSRDNLFLTVLLNGWIPQEKQFHPCGVSLANHQAVCLFPFPMSGVVKLHGLASRVVIRPVSSAGEGFKMMTREISLTLLTRDTI